MFSPPLWLRVFIILTGQGLDGGALARGVALRPVLAGELATALQRVLAEPGMQIVNRRLQIISPALALADKGEKIAAARRAKLFRPDAEKPV